MLSTHLIHEAVAQGLVTDRLFDDWDETPIWCPACGRRRLYGKRVPGGRLWLICRPCHIPVNMYATVGPYCGVRGFSATFQRSLVEYDCYFGSGTAGLTAHCCRCDRPLPYRPTTECWLNGINHYLHLWCANCRAGSGQFGATWHLLASPEGRQFRQDHPRLRFLPDQEIEASGVPAIVVRAESMTSLARLEGVYRRDTFERILVTTPLGPLS